MTEAIQRSLAGGELSPALHARADMVKFMTGLKICRNFQVQKHGGAANRAGTEFAVEIKDSTKTVALLGFEFNAAQTYILEFGDQYMRIVRDGGHITVTGVSAWVTSTAYVVGDLASNGGTNYYCYLAHTSSATDEPGVGANWADYWHALTDDIYEIPTPYVEADLMDLHYVQSGDVITIVHPSYEPRELRRFGTTNWTFNTMVFEPTVSRPTNLAVSPGAAGGTQHSYKVTAIGENFEESFIALEAPLTITNATQTNPVVITTSTTILYFNGDEVYIDGIVGMTEINGGYFEVNVLTGTTMELVGEDGTGHTAYVSGGESSRTSLTLSTAIPTSSAPNVVSWTAVQDALEYYIYKRSNGIYGYIGATQNASFSDEGFTANVAETPPIIRNPFEDAGNYPSEVTYYQQRQIFGNTNNDPEKVWASRSADFNNFNISSPLRDDDSVVWTIAGREVNQVRNMVELDRLIVLTSGGEHLIEGDVDGVLRPGKVNPKQQGHNGSSGVRPIAISNTAIYLQARGSVVRDLRISKDEGYTGSDLTVFANHLFDGYTIVDWDYAQIPNSTLWAIRSDGALLGLTYLPEHEVWGWHRHDTDGFYENVRVIPEGNEDVPYFVVRRTINGVTKRYIERMKSRLVTDIAIDAFFVDCGLTYDGRNTTADTMTLSGGTTWEYTEDLTLTSSTGYFVAGDVGNAIVLKLVDSEGTITDTVKCTITAFTSTTVVTVNPNKTVPVGFQGVALSDWGKAVDTVSGLGHLEAKSVNALSDGNVEGPFTVTSGSITLQETGEVIHVGLPIESDLETLDIDTAKQPLGSKKKLVSSVTLNVEASRGIWVGPDADTLSEFAQREFEEWGEPTALKTGNITIPIEGEWNDTGRIFIRQNDPLPLTVLSIIPEGAVSD